MVVDPGLDGPEGGTYGGGGDENKVWLNNVQQRRGMVDELKNRYGKAIIQQRPPPVRIFAIVTRLVWNRK